MKKGQSRKAQQTPNPIKPLLTVTRPPQKDRDLDPVLDDLLHREWRLDKAPIRSVSHAFCG